MINFENDQNKKIFNINLVKVLIAIVLSVIVTYIIINFIPFSDMLDEYKLSFKTSTLQEIVKYYSFTIAIIVISIYSVLYFAIYSLVKFIFNKLKKDEENG